MWIVAEIKRRQLNRDEIFTMHTVIKQGVRVIFQYHLFPRVPLKSLVILSIRMLVRIRRPQVLWTKHCHTCRPSLLNQTSVRYIEIDTKT